MIEEVLIRTDYGGSPCGVDCAVAYYGFKQLGVGVSWFDGDLDLPRARGVSPTVGVVGTFGDVHTALRSIGAPVPKPLDYPSQLSGYYHRDIEETTLGEVKKRKYRVFVKPKRHKLFTGFVWKPGCEHCRKKVVTIQDDEPVWTSTVMNIVSEYRCFVLNHEILDVRRYAGDWSVAPVHDAVWNMVWDYTNSPAAYALDVHVGYLGRTSVTEVNDGYAFRSYGLDSVLYAKMLSARWEEMVKPVQLELPLTQPTS